MMICRQLLPQIKDNNRQLRGQNDLLELSSPIIYMLLSKLGMTIADVQETWTAVQHMVLSLEPLQSKIDDNIFVTSNLHEQSLTF